MRRREFIAAVGGAALAPRAVYGEPPEQVRRIGVLTWWGEYDPEAQSQAIALSQGLAKLGWSSGRNVRIEYRRASGDINRMPAFAKDLVGRKPEVIVGVTTPAVTALRNETRSIPIVFTEVSDPVGSGFVETLAHPGGNATGFVDIEASFSGKWMAMLKELDPSLTRIALMFNPRTAPGAGTYYLPPFETAARALAIEPIASRVYDPADIASTMADLAHSGGGGLILMPDLFILTHRDVVIAQAARNKLPAIYPYGFFVTSGGLISYGVGLAEQNRQASYIDRIFKGANPADLPVQLPTLFELVINLNTAKALGITVPATLLANADAVIE